jgi:hypothetical protein
MALINIETTGMSSQSMIYGSKDSIIIGIGLNGGGV